MWIIEHIACVKECVNSEVQFSINYMSIIAPAGAGPDAAGHQRRHGGTARCASAGTARPTPAPAADHLDLTMESIARCQHPGGGRGEDACSHPQIHPDLVHVQPWQPHHLQQQQQRDVDVHDPVCSHPLLQQHQSPCLAMQQQTNKQQQTVCPGSAPPPIQVWMINNSLTHHKCCDALGSGSERPNEITE